MPPTSPCEGCCVKMVQFIGTDHYQVLSLNYDIDRLDKNINRKQYSQFFMVLLPKVEHSLKPTKTKLYVFNTIFENTCKTWNLY